MFTTVRIVGPSMEPTMRTGECWVVRRTSRFRPGQVVLLRHPVRPDLLLVKRVIAEPEPGRWWVEGDNPLASDDSRVFGTVAGDAIMGCVIFRYSPVIRKNRI